MRYFDILPELRSLTRILSLSFVLLLPFAALQADGKSLAVLTMVDAAVTGEPTSTESGVSIELEARGTVQRVTCPRGFVARHCFVLEPGDIVSVTAVPPPSDLDGDPSPVVTGILIKPEAETELPDDPGDQD